MRIVAPRAVKTGVGDTRNVFGVPFVEPQRHVGTIEPVDHEVRRFVPQRVPLELETRVSLDKQRTALVDAAGPGIEVGLCLKGFPVLRLFEDENVGFAFPVRGIFVQIAGDHPVIKLRLHRNRRGDETMEIVVDEIVGFRVLPFGGADGERGCSQRRDVRTGKRRERLLLQTVESGGWLRQLRQPAPH